MSGTNKARHAALTRRSLLAGGAALALAPGGANAQSFPSGPVKIVTSVGAGSSPDVCARVLADYLTKLWGQQVVVLNQPGGAGAVAIKAVAPAAPDGHTLYMSLATNFIALPQLQENFPVDVLRDFVPIGYVGDHPMVIAAGRDLGVTTLPDLIALAKKRKGELNIASGNRGSILHLTGEWLRSATGIDVTLVHYPSASGAIADILGGRVHAMIDAVPAMRGAIEGGQLKALAVATQKRLPNFPNLPTVAETLPGFEAVGWLAMMAPPGTPAALARKISDDMRNVLAQPEFRKRYEDLGTYIRLTTPEELTVFIREQQRIWGPVIAETAKKIKQ
jgi:tripartite-type tricarboxylate transporter receptor subunit TctC